MGENGDHVIIQQWGFILCLILCQCSVLVVKESRGRDNAEGGEAAKKAENASEPTIKFDFESPAYKAEQISHEVASCDGDKGQEGQLEAAERG